MYSAFIAVVVVKRRDRDTNCRSENTSPNVSDSLALPSKIAYLMSQKYVEGLPLYHQEKKLERIGVCLSRQSMANWMVYGADHWLTHLHNRMHTLLLQHDILQTDETTLQVLTESGRSVTAKSYM